MRGAPMELQCLCLFCVESHRLPIRSGIYKLWYKHRDTRVDRHNQNKYYASFSTTIEGANQSSPNIILRFSIDSESFSPCPLNASFTIAVLRFCILRTRSSIVFEICLRYVNGDPQTGSSETYDEMRHKDCFFLTDAVDTVNCYSGYERVSLN